MSFRKTVLLRDTDAPPAPAAEPPAAPEIIAYGQGSSSGPLSMDFGSDDDIVDDPAPAEPPAPAAPAPDPAKPAVPAAEPPAPPAPPAVPEPVTPPAPAAPEAKVDWKAELKKAPKADVLKELGLDDFTIKMLEHKEKTGSYMDYLQTQLVDYSKMSPEQLLKLDIKKSHPGFSETSIDLQYKKLTEDKYYLNRELFPDGSAEANYGQELLKHDTDQIRSTLLKEQADFKAPEPQSDDKANQRKAELQQRQATVSTAVMNNPETKSIAEGKKITFGEGESSFSLPVADPQVVIDTAKNMLANYPEIDLSTVDFKSLYAGYVMGQDPYGTAEKLIAHGSAVMHKKMQDELQNRVPPPPGPASADDKVELTPYGANAGS